MSSLEQAPVRDRRRGEHSAQTHSGVVREQIADIQRERIVAGMLDAFAQPGFGNGSVEGVVKRAGVSRRTFYELFTGWDDCFLAAFEHALTCAREYVLPAYDAADGWRARIRAGLLALLCFLDEEPVLGGFLFAGSQGHSARVLERRNEAISALTHAVEQGEAKARTSVAPSSLMAEGIVGGALSVIHSRLSEPDSLPLSTLANPLMGMIVLPYLGPAAARREQAASVVVPPPTVRGRASDVPAPPASGNPLLGLPMRLTYRTALVLSCIAQHPGASNRAIGKWAGVPDQGQISKLLARLERLGLTVNGGEGQPKGEPNAWRLTPKGDQVQQRVQVTHPDRHEAA